MHKFYTLSLEPWASVFVLVYIYLSIKLLIVVSKKYNVGFSASAIAGLVVYYYLVFIASSFLSWVPYFPDTRLFASLIVDGSIPEHMSLGVKLFYTITYPLRLLSFNTLELFMVFQIFIFILSLMILWKSWQIVLKQEGKASDYGLSLFLGLSAVYPAFLLYIPMVLREFVVLLGFSVMVYGFIKRYYENGGLLAIALGALLLIASRPHLVIVIVIFFAVFQKQKWLRYGLLFGSIFIGPFLFTYLIGYSDFSPEYLAHIRNYHNGHYPTMGYGAVDWHSYADMMYDIPALFLQFVLSPLPILHQGNPLEYMAAFLDLLFIILLLVATFYSGVRRFKIYLFIFFVGALFFSIWEFHLISAVRHRMPLVAILLPVASYGLMKFFEDKKYLSFLESNGNKEHDNLSGLQALLGRNIKWIVSGGSMVMGFFYLSYFYNPISFIGQPKYEVVNVLSIDGIDVIIQRMMDPEIFSVDVSEYLAMGLTAGVLIVSLSLIVRGLLKGSTKLG